MKGHIPEGTRLVSSSNSTGVLELDSSTSVEGSLPEDTMWVVIEARGGTERPGLDEPPDVPERAMPTVERRSAKEREDIAGRPFFARQ